VLPPNLATLAHCWVVAGGLHTAILAASDQLSLGAIRAVRRQGGSVPGDVSVVRYDDSALMQSVDPPLTTIRQPIESMGRPVVELLVKRIEDGRVAAEELLYTPELVVHGSTGRSPVVRKLQMFVAILRPLLSYFRVIAVTHGGREEASDGGTGTSSGRPRRHGVLLQH
jgi:Periplasmic binding protein-like domain